MPEPSATTVALIARWDTFLAKIEGAFTETLEGAEPALLEVLFDDDGGVNAFLQSVQAIRSQVHGLLGKVGETWSEKVCPRLIESDPEAVTWDGMDEAAKGTQLTESAHRRLSRWDTVVCGRGAERLHKQTLSQARTTFRCTLCSADMEITEDLFRSHYETCPYCSGRNTYESSVKLRETLHFTADHIARYRALDLHDQLDAAHDVCRAIRGPVPEPQISDLRALHMTYHEAVLRARFAIVPDFESTLEDDLARRAREFDITEFHLRCIPVPAELYGQSPS